MTYNPYQPQLIKEKNDNGTYKVVRIQKGKSGQILRDQMNKQDAERYMRSVRP